MPLSVVTTAPDAATRSAVHALAATIEHEDGAPPLSDQALSGLGSSTVTHLVAFENDRPVGYAQLYGSGLEIAAEHAAVERLLKEALQRTSTPLLVWSHGARSRLVGALETHHFARARELLQLRRPSEIALPADPPLADDITIRAFVPGRDDAAWLAVNAAAFAAHAEQGGWTQADLRARIDEPWFDAAGFLLAERGGELLGYHWTKVHPDGAGEVYVLGVSPQAQGLGLGKGLLVRGLRHLLDRGCPQVLLYVDGDNAAASALYEQYGFTRYDLDVQWRQA